MMQNFLINDPFSILEDRKDLNPTQFSYKLNQPGQFGLDVELGDLDLDEKSMSCWITFANGLSRDGVGDITEIGGINTERHRKNPIVLFDHGKEVKLPIALTEDPNTHEYTVQLDPVSRIGRAKCFFYQGRDKELGEDQLSVLRQSNISPKTHAQFVHEIFDMLAQRYIRAGSFAYQIIRADRLQPDYSQGTPPGLHLISTRLLELGPTVIPAHQDTVAKMLSMPGRSNLFYKSLACYGGECRVVQVTGGFDSKAYKQNQIKPDQEIQADYDKYHVRNQVISGATDQRLMRHPTRGGLHREALRMVDTARKYDFDPEGRRKYDIQADYGKGILIGRKALSKQDLIAKYGTKDPLKEKVRAELIKEKLAAHRQQVEAEHANPTFKTSAEHQKQEDQTVSTARHPIAKLGTDKRGRTRQMVESAAEFERRQEHPVYKAARRAERGPLVKPSKRSKRQDQRDLTREAQATLPDLPHRAGARAIALHRYGHSGKTKETNELRARAEAKLTRNAAGEEHNLKKHPKYGTHMPSYYTGGTAGATPYRVHKMQTEHLAVAPVERNPNYQRHQKLHGKVQHTYEAGQQKMRDKRQVKGKSLVEARNWHDDDDYRSLETGSKAIPPAHQVPEHYQRASDVARHPQAARHPSPRLTEYPGVPEHAKRTMKWASRRRTERPENLERRQQKPVPGVPTKRGTDTEAEVARHEAERRGRTYKPGAEQSRLNEHIGQNTARLREELPKPPLEEKKKKKRSERLEQMREEMNEATHRYHRGHSPPRVLSREEAEVREALQPRTAAQHKLSRLETLRAKYGKKALPSDSIKPGKACQILHDGTAQGHELSKNQRGMFGAACGKKSSPQDADAIMQRGITRANQLHKQGMEKADEIFDKYTSINKTPQKPSMRDLGTVQSITKKNSKDIGGAGDFMERDSRAQLNEARAGAIKSRTQLKEQRYYDSMSPRKCITGHEGYYTQGDNLVFADTVRKAQLKKKYKKAYHHSSMNPGKLGRKVARRNLTRDVQREAAETLRETNQPRTPENMRKLVEHSDKIGNTPQRRGGLTERSKLRDPKITDEITKDKRRGITIEHSPDYRISTAGEGTARYSPHEEDYDYEGPSEPSERKRVRRLVRQDRELRQKYGKKSIGTARCLKKSQPGTFLVYCDQKDIPAFETDSKSSRVKFLCTSVDEKGLSKVKLTGLDDAVQKLAQRYGKPGSIGRKLQQGNPDGQEVKEDAMGQVQQKGIQDGEKGRVTYSESGWEGPPPAYRPRQRQQQPQQQAARPQPRPQAAQPQTRQGTAKIVKNPKGKVIVTGFARDWKTDPPPVRQQQAGLQTARQAKATRVGELKAKYGGRGTTELRAPAARKMIKKEINQRKIEANQIMAQQQAVQQAAAAKPKNRLPDPTGAVGPKNRIPDPGMR